ncbi:lysophospholipid acyltransferase family protein [Sulfurimonas paralvinellae]|uniref:1-acyl-sn-glycerol-3-phosphate acyltransferase n=1 Tax=Sulfurimonas paralvinellae TaxID=317658 RepID=A0A7M1B6Z1_9BACT|nr:lysophospholipid acyltransferase family protein [Sulfurimonas paralvinellae]QOP45499.1 1-acyl-sn-glycerol-3-phosphate acyltransferase [Sulfurimonas paralvinellae]
MFKDLGKYIFMIELGAKYIKVFKKIYFHPFITLKYGYKELSRARGEYSNKVLEFLNIKVKLIGEIPKKDKVLYAINHRSLLDIIVMENIFYAHDKNGTWIAKQELFDDPIYGRFFEYSGCISVDLENKRGLINFFKTIKKVFSKVDDMNLYIFPEGERYKGEGIQKFQSGAAKIAKANNLDIVPIYIKGKNEEAFKNAPYEKPFTIEVYAGDIISYENLEEKYLEFYNSVK